MTRGQKVRLTVTDDFLWTFLEGGLPFPPKGILFRYPLDWGVRSKENEPESLHEQAFKMAAIICENAARNYSSYPFFKRGRCYFVFNWHYSQYLKVRRILITRHNWPSKFTDALLPRLLINGRFPIAHPDIIPEIYENVCHRHRDRDYEKYYRLRW